MSFDDLSDPYPARAPFAPQAPAELLSFPVERIRSVRPHPAEQRLLAAEGALRRELEGLAAERLKLVEQAEALAAQQQVLEGAVAAQRRARAAAEAEIAEARDAHRRFEQALTGLAALAAAGLAGGVLLLILTLGGAA